jgi:cytochrome c oxidase assembly factor CtaG
VLRPTGPELAGLAATALVLAPMGGAALLNALVPGLAYVAGAKRFRSTGRAWPGRRTTAALAALLVLGAATSAVADDRAQASLAWHMAQQMALLFLVSLGIVAGRPDILVRGRRNPRVRPLGGPALTAAWLAIVSAQWIVHIPAVLDGLWDRPAALAALHWLLLAVGVAFFGCAFAAVRSGRYHPLVVGLYVVSIMAGTDAIGLWLLFDPNVVYDSYTGTGALADQHRAGAVMFTAGMVPLLAAARIVHRSMWVGSDP